MDKNEIIIYQPDASLKLDVLVEDESVWLNQMQMAELFQTTKQNISLHTNNVFKEGELDASSVVKESLTTANDGKRYRTKYYNLDVIISVGYRVKSIRGTQFRQWANKILKDYLIRGYSINQRLMLLEDRVDRRLSDQDRQLLKMNEKIDFIVRSSIKPKEGIFFDGQIFDAYAFAADLIRQAKAKIILIDNYIDESVLVQLSKREAGVRVEIYDGNISKQLRQDVDKHDEQYPGISLHKYTKCHDRFLIIDDQVYHIGASLKDLGKKLFAFSKLETISASEILDKIE